MELGELVAVIVDTADSGCPYPHYPRPKPNPVPENKWDNNSGKLCTSLNGASKKNLQIPLPHLENAPIATGPSGKPNYVAWYNPHHLIPGDASWPNTSVKKWMDGPGNRGEVEHDIGYNVNGYYNGIDLPASTELHAPRGDWTSKSEDFQNRYAFAAMRAEPTTRQFHDSHEAYSDFVANSLEKIAARLAVIEKKGGCGDEDCAMKGAKKPYPVPTQLLSRVNGVALRLSGYLHGNAKKWKKPIFTSKFALIYKNKNLSQLQAADQLNVQNFKYPAP